MTDVPTSPLAELLERGRSAARISGREAARRAGVSETRWRQVVAAGQVPPAHTIVGMALAVGVAPDEALRTAGYEVDLDVLAGLVENGRRRPPARRARTTDGGGGLVEEIERVRNLPIEPEDKIRIVNTLIELYEEQAHQSADQRALA